MLILSKTNKEAQTIAEECASKVTWIANPDSLRGHSQPLFITKSAQDREDWQIIQDILLAHRGPIFYEVGLCNIKP